jgi:anaphase-promoting complex subunit 10
MANVFRPLPIATEEPALIPLSEGLRKDNKQELGGLAVWSLSSAKPGFGVEQLRDDNLNTYWQSDGTQPHLVNIQWPRKMTLEEVCLYLNYKQDESYTPNKISFRIGTIFHDLYEIKVVELNEPLGWISIKLTQPNGRPVRTFFLQIAILSNHQNGRDTHIRQIKIFGPRPYFSLCLLFSYTAIHLIDSMF